MNKFIHLNVKSDYSIMEGVAKISAYILKAKELEMKALGIAERSNMFSAFEFYTQCINNDIKPIIGIDLNIKENIFPSTSYGLLLYAKNFNGYLNLVKIASLISRESPVPNVTIENLTKFSKDLIVVSPFVNGIFSQYLSNGNVNEALKYLEKFTSIFPKEDIYLELQAKKGEQYKVLLDKIKDFAIKTNIEAVATNSVYYANKEDKKLFNLVKDISNRKRTAELDEGDNNELYFKSSEEMETDFADCKNALNVSAEIADKIDIQIPKKRFVFPKYELEATDNYRSIDYLRNLAKKNIEVRYPNSNSDDLSALEHRINYELSVIDQLELADYFLVVHDLIKFAKQQSILVGPGRGSGASSIISYLIGITEVDPMKYGLIFERFLGLKRGTLPDIDIDICSARRDELILYLQNKYATERVAHVGTFGTFTLRSAIREVAKLLAVDNSSIETVLSDLEINRDPKKLLAKYSKNERLKEVIEYSILLDGNIRNFSTHASGIVIVDSILTDYTPTVNINNINVTQYSMEILEKIGIVKLDLLGLKNLTMLQKITDYIEQYKSESVNLQNIKLDDIKTYNLIAGGNTQGIFQLESKLASDVCTRIKPVSIEELALVLAINRPGPLKVKAVTDYLNGKAAIVDDMSKLIEPLVKDSKGLLIYQEQIMNILQSIGGYELEEAYMLVKAISKKKSEYINAEKANFIKKASLQISKELATKLFDQIASFASYCFPKAHAISYSLITYYLAYFKANYNLEFYAALLDSDHDNDKTSLYIAEMRKNDVKFKNPDVNYSQYNSIVNNGNIILGLNLIRYIGELPLRSILDERGKNGPYATLTEFIDRNRSCGNRLILEPLIFSGSLDSLDGSRRNKYRELNSQFQTTNSLNNAQRSLFSISSNISVNVNVNERLEERKINLKELSQYELLLKEKRFLGYNTSIYPLDRYKDKISDAFKALRNDKDAVVEIIGVVSNIRRLLATEGKPIMLINLELYNKEILVLYSKSNERIQNLKESDLLYCKGKFNENNSINNMLKRRFGDDNCPVLESDTLEILDT